MRCLGFISKVSLELKTAWFCWGLGWDRWSTGSAGTRAFAHSGFPKRAAVFEWHGSCGCIKGQRNKLDPRWLSFVGQGGANQIGAHLALPRSKSFACLAHLQPARSRRSCNLFIVPSGNLSSGQVAFWSVTISICMKQNTHEQTETNIHKP